MPLQNGVETVDLLAAQLGTKHVAGGLCGGFCFIVAPGHVKHIGGVTFIKFGELDGRSPPRVERLRAEFVKARRRRRRARRHSGGALGEAHARRAVRRHRRRVARADRRDRRTPPDARAARRRHPRDRSGRARAQGVQLSRPTRPSARSRFSTARRPRQRRRCSATSRPASRRSSTRGRGPSSGWAPPTACRRRCTPLYTRRCCRSSGGRAARPRSRAAAARLSSGRASSDPARATPCRGRACAS